MFFGNSRIKFSLKLFGLIVNHIERINTRKEYKGIQHSSVFKDFKIKWSLANLCKITFILFDWGPIYQFIVCNNSMQSPVHFQNISIFFPFLHKFSNNFLFLIFFFAHSQPVFKCQRYRVDWLSNPKLSYHYQHAKIIQSICSIHQIICEIH